MNKLYGLFISLVVAIAPISTGQATLVNLTNPIAYPGITNAVVGSPTLATAAALDATGEYVAYVFAAREAMTISHVTFRAGTAANSPTIEVRIETVDTTTGLPTGTLWATNTNGTTGAVSSNSNPIQALTASASITKGQIFCVKLLWGGVATSSLNIQHLQGVAGQGNGSLPYKVINTGTPTKSANFDLALIGLGSSSTAFYNAPGAMPLNAAASSNFNNTNSAKRGLKFTLPFNARITGVRFWSATTVGDYNVAIFDSSGSPLGSTSTAYDGNQNANSNSGLTNAIFSTAFTATAGVTYYAAVEPSTSTNTSVGLMTLASTDYFGATPAGSASSAVYSSFSSVGGVWTDSTTQLLMLDLLIDQIDNGGGGGGGGRIIGG